MIFSIIYYLDIYNFQAHTFREAMHTAHIVHRHGRHIPNFVFTHTWLDNHTVAVSLGPNKLIEVVSGKIVGWSSSMAYPIPTNMIFSIMIDVLDDFYKMNISNRQKFAEEEPKGP